MALTNAERQARYKQRLKEAATPAWLIKEFPDPEDARGTIVAFREFFGHLPAPDGLQLLKREREGKTILLVKMPWPLGEADAAIMKGWRLAKEDAEDLGFWRKVI